MAEVTLNVEARVRRLWLARMAAAVPFRRLQLWAARQIRVEYRVSGGMWRQIPFEVSESFEVSKAQ